MSFDDFDPFENLPDELKEALREMVKRLESINPEELNDMMSELFGDETIDKIRKMVQNGGIFGFPLDPKSMKNMEAFMQNLMNRQATQNNFYEETDEDPYFEISPIVNGEGQIIVELPGIEDVRQVNWKRELNNLKLAASFEDINYNLEIPIEENYRLKDSFADVKNSVFTLPFKID